MRLTPFSIAALGGLLVAAASALPVVHAQTPAPAAPGAATAADPVAAKVDGETIRRSDVQQAFEGLPPELRQAGLPAIYPMLLERMVQRRLLSVRGREEELEKEPQVKEALRDYEDQLVARLYLERLVEKNMGEEVLREQYERYVAANPPQEEVRASHILVPEEATARKIIDEVAGGKEFAAAAREHSTGPSAQKGGDLGYFSKSDMVQPFADAAFGMQPGEVTKNPVKTQFGWHVIKMVDRRQSAVPSFEELRLQLAEAAQRDVATNVMEDLTDKAAVERFTLEGEPMPKGAAAPGAQ